MLPHVTRRAILLPTVFGLIATFELAHLCQAGPRATEAQMDTVTQPLAEYFKDIRANYQLIDGLILKRGQVATEEAIGLFKSQQDTVQEPVDKAIYSYLTARAYYWDGYRRFKTSMDRRVFSELQPKVIEGYLESFRELHEAEATDQTVQRIRASIIQQFEAALTTNIWGGGLPDKLRENILTQFMDVLEKEPDFERLFPPGPGLVTIYTNLGIRDRVHRLVPPDLPAEYYALIAYEAKYETIMSLEQRQQVAETVEREHRDKLAKDAFQLDWLGHVNEDAGRLPKALDMYRRAAALWSKYDLDLYLLELRPDLGVSATERDQHLADYLDGSTAGIDTSDGLKYSRNDAYYNAAASLLLKKHYKECLALIGRYDKDASITDSGEARISMHERKAKCLEALGEKESAAQAYQSLLVELKGCPTQGYKREDIERRIRTITIERIGGQKQ